jgi:hypothetical protein
LEGVHGNRAMRHGDSTITTHVEASQGVDVCVEGWVVMLDKSFGYFFGTHGDRLENKR